MLFIGFYQIQVLGRLLITGKLLTLGLIQSLCILAVRIIDRRIQFTKDLYSTLYISRFIPEYAIGIQMRIEGIILVFIGNIVGSLRPRYQTIIFFHFGDLLQSVGGIAVIIESNAALLEILKRSFIREGIIRSIHNLKRIGKLDKLIICRHQTFALIAGINEAILLGSVGMCFKRNKLSSVGVGKRPHNQCLVTALNAPDTLISVGAGY